MTGEERATAVVDVALSLARKMLAGAITMDEGKRQVREFQQLIDSPASSNQNGNHRVV